MAVTRPRRLTSLLLLRPPATKANHLPSSARHKTTSAAHVAARHIDHTFEKLMDCYKHYLRVISVHDLILASPGHSLALPFLSSLSQKLRLNRGSAPYFLRKYPHTFSFSYDTTNSHPCVRLTPAAAEISRQESAATESDPSATIHRLSRLLSMSPTRTLPLRAVFKVWRELGFPDDFEESILLRNPSFFRVRDNPRERNTHLLELVDTKLSTNFIPEVEKWRNLELQSENSKLEEAEIRFGFKQRFPPGMKLKKNYRAKLKEWQRLPYSGPFDGTSIGGDGERRSRAGMMAMEKRAVGIVHEFLSLTVEKMVEVEQISQFRKWFGIELNIRDLFLDHPGIFYLSTKGKRHTVFLREAYDRGRLVDPNPVYEARRKLLDLVLLGRRGMGLPDFGETGNSSGEGEVDADSDF